MGSEVSGGVGWTEKGRVSVPGRGRCTWENPEAFKGQVSSGGGERPWSWEGVRVSETRTRGWTSCCAQQRMVGREGSEGGSSKLRVTSGSHMVLREDLPRTPGATSESALGPAQHEKFLFRVGALFSSPECSPRTNGTLSSRSSLPSKGKRPTHKP